MKRNDCHPFTAAQADGLRAAAIRANDRALAKFFAKVCQAHRAGATYAPGARLKASGGKARRP